MCLDRCVCVWIIVDMFASLWVYGCVRDVVCVSEKLWVCQRRRGSVRDVGGLSGTS